MKFSSCKQLITIFSEIQFLKTSMVYECFESIQIEVLPGVGLPAPAADFIFSRVAWIHAGEKGSFNLEAPASFEFHDLATLAYLVATNDSSAARLMVSNLLRPSTNMLPSASLVNRNDNYLRSNPFRRRRKQKRGECAVGNVHEAVDQVNFISY